MLAPEAVKEVAVIGTGVIGRGWAAHFLRQGLFVTAYDPAPGSESQLREMIASVWPALEKLGLKGGASRDRLRFAPDLQTAVAQAQFIQENAPERLALKQELLAEIDAASLPSSVIASSTSGYAMTDLQKRCNHHPQRLVVGHPFNPPYLAPLVEVVGGDKTDPEVVKWTERFYAFIGKKPLKMSKELPGFIANRLQEALWREALHMVNEGMATVAEIDAAVRWGPGLRWAFMGPCLTFHLAGGQGGMRHMLEHFDPQLFSDWTFLASPPMTEELIDAMAAGCEKEANGRSIGELEEWRDNNMIALLNALEQT